MVQGLAFLSKKSWHTKNKVNQEKVWIAEQQKEQEVAKANELAKEIQQERENEELNRIAGKTTIKDRGIDWMYQEGTNHELAKEDAHKEAEEFLLGKEFVGEGAVQGDFHDGNQKEGICNALTKTTEAAAGINKQQPDELQKYRSEAQVNADHNSVHYRNENFRMRNEDPMFLVSQKQRQNIDKHEHVKELYQRVVGPVKDKESSDDDDESAHNQKRLKKERKRHKKEKKKKKKSSRRSDDYEESDRSHSRRRRRRSRSRSHSYSRSRSPSRSRSNERNRRRYKSDDRDRDRNRNGNRNRDYDSRSDGSYDSRRDRYRDDKYHDRHHDKIDHRDSRRNRQHYDEEKNKSYNNDGKDDRNYSRNVRRDHNDERSSSRKNAPSYPPKQNEKSEPKQNDKREPKKIEGYGLKGAPTPVFDSRDIGPSKELLRKKKEEIEQTRRQNNQKGSRKRLTEEERAVALQQMQTDAKTREGKMGRQASYRKNDVDEEKEASTRKGASFLNDITKGAHGLDGNNSLSSRVAQNRHTQQRLHDNFL
jgi:hypothetical protein